MFIFTALVLFTVSITAPVQAAPNAMTIGHNVSPTSYTLAADELTLGSYAVGYGITDNWMIATSPWMIVNYNMPMIATRFAFASDSVIHRFAIEFDYFKTFEYGFNLFKQESFFVRMVATHRFSKNYAMHANAGYQHFYDDNSPYSLRPVWNLSDPTTLSIGALHEVNVAKDLGFFFETALLGVNYPVMYAHIGASIFARSSWGFVQLGVSRSMPLGSPGWYLVTQRDGSEQYTFMRGASFHPEIQLQFSL